MTRNVLARIVSENPRLAMCKKMLDGYEPMQYYVVVVDQQDIRDKHSEGFFIGNSIGRYDFFPMDEFNEFFSLIDESPKSIYTALSFLRNQRKFYIKIEPIITCGGYFYEYELRIGFPFTKKDVYETNFSSHHEAAKRAINLAREACLEKHAKDGIFFWLNYTRVKKC